MRISEIAHTRVRYGFARIFVPLQREGFADNHKRVYRICACGLNLRTKRPRRNRMAVRRFWDARKLWAINQVWSTDFVQDALFNGERFRVLIIVDNW